MEMSKSRDKKKNYVSYKVDGQTEEVKMATSNGGIPISKTLDSIASLPKDDKIENGELDFKRPGVLLMAKSDAEGGNGDLLFAGLFNRFLLLKTYSNIFLFNSQIVPFCAMILKVKM